MYLAAKRTEAEAIINEATIANFAGIGNAFPWPRLRPLVQKNHFSTIDHICLDTWYVKILLYLIHSYNIMIRRSPYLPKTNSRKLQKLNTRIKEPLPERTWMVRWSLWWERQREQSGSLVQSKQYMLHSLLWESTWNLQWTKNCSLSRGFSHGGHRLSSSSGPPAPYNKNQYRVLIDQFQNITIWYMIVYIYLKRPFKHIS